MSTRRRRIVAFAGTRAYQTGELLQAAAGLGIELVIASDRCHVLADHYGEAIDTSIAVDFDDPAAAIEAVLAAGPVDGAVATDERTAPLAAALANAIGRPASEPEAARRAGDKLEARRVLSGAGLRQPAFAELDLARPRAPMGFPAVIKPRCLSASRGVMRVDSPAELEAAAARLSALLADPEIRGVHGELAASAVIESFVAGDEVAYEGLLRDGALERLAIFDKPDPLDGPVFAETIYATPTSLDEEVCAALDAEVAAAAAALGLRHGPVHAEVRRGAGGAVVLELAARSIGGLCGRTLRLAGGHSVEALVLAAAAGIEIDRPPLLPAGVLMLPVEAAGVLVAVEGVERARAIEGVREVEITARPGDVLLPLPEGASYLGFVFATAESRDAVIAALRQARATIATRVRPRL